MRQYAPQLIEDETNMLRALRQAVYTEDDGLIVTAASPMPKQEQAWENDLLLVDKNNNDKKQPDSRDGKVIIRLVSSEEIIAYRPAQGERFYFIKAVPYEELIAYFGQQRPRVQPGALEMIISDVCLRVGMPPQIQGCSYVQSALRIVVLNRNAIYQITKDIYPVVAAEYDTSSSKVERSIRHAVTVLWQRGRAQAINELYGYRVCAEEKKPSNGEFIGILANLCRQRIHA